MGIVTCAETMPALSRQGSLGKHGFKAGRELNRLNHFNRVNHVNY